MIYFLNINGTTTLVKSEPVYQNSIDANKLVVFAPFSAFAQVSTTFTLPNGLDVQGGLMSRLVGDAELLDKKGNKYNAWYLDLDSPITQYPGTVRVQFSITLGQGKTQASYSTQFIVEKGVPGDLPNYVVGDDALAIFEDIKNYLAEIEGEMQNALENGISYIRYMSPENELSELLDTDIKLYVVDGDSTVLSTNPVVPDLTNGDFTVTSMTEYLTDEQIRNPGIPPYNDQNFFQYNTSGEETPKSPAGFIIDLGSAKDVGLIQLYIWGIVKHSEAMQVQVSVNSGNAVTQPFEVVNTFYINELEYNGIKITNEMTIIPVPINRNARFIKVVQTTGWTDGAFIYKGVEVFKSNYDGYYSIVQNNGNEYKLSAIDMFSAIAIINEARSYSTEAQKWAVGTNDSQDPQYNNSAKDWAGKSGAYTEEAQKWADGEGAVVGDEQYQNNAKYYTNILTQYPPDQVGGFPRLILENGRAVIPPTMISKVSTNELIEITEESQLNTVDAQVGDVAYLVVDLDGEKTIVKSWVLLAINNGVRDWAVQGTSFAATAGSANYADLARNAAYVRNNIFDVVTESDYNNTIVDKTGVYFVLMGE